ncbi:DUF6584 family protein [Kitasatospora phosalacinea]|uniref:Uncharacterized protein n=1 Tax=Kitasatospora phosalacinea TaxID=2065 RepID=A0A9W6PBE0_9ACTN|nr:DUF6584 family protein [Kitasatospora phosalacinea]GLW52655.1 hypothetical protein Kpho01_06660 [Kitasatospora phosalacinea]
MSVESTLAKVAAELRANQHRQARLRLRGLLSSHPTDLALRRRFADAYQRIQHPEQAGRWNYLDESLSFWELGAFEQCFRDPARRLALLFWPDPAHNPPPTRTARRRLAGLYWEATGTAPDWPEHRRDAAVRLRPEGRSPWEEDRALAELRERLSRGPDSPAPEAT